MGRRSGCRTAAGTIPRFCWQRFGRSALIQSGRPRPLMPITNSRKAHRARERERRALAIVTAGLAMLLLGSGALWLLPAPLVGASSIGGPFELTGGDGKPVTDRDLRGKYVLIYFGYTFCQDVCPITLQRVADALKALGAKSAELQPLFITVDTQRETPQVVGQYAAAFSPRLIGLTGTSDQISRVEREFHVYTAIRRSGVGRD